MENQQYLNKSLKLAKEVIKNSQVHMEQINRIIPQLKSEIKAIDINAYNQLDEMQSALNNGDFKKVIELKNKLDAYNK